MSNPVELELAIKAIKSGIDGCVEWDNDEVDRIEKELLGYGLDLRVVRKTLIEHVRNGGKVVQKDEIRAEKKERRHFWYRIIVPMPQFRKGLFVEVELTNTDPELPEIRILNAHEQR